MAGEAISAASLGQLGVWGSSLTFKVWPGDDTIILVKGPSTLRTQLILGLTIILLVAAVSVGVIVHWATRQQVTELQLSQAESVGRGIGQLLSSTYDRGELQRIVTHFVAGPYIDSVDVVDENQKVMATSHGEGKAPLVGVALRAPQFTRVLSTDEMVRRLLDKPKPFLEMTLPLQWDNGIRGAARVRVPLAPISVRWSILFWFLMAANGLALVFFVAFVVARYVAGPLHAMERAALQVAEGDLNVR
ncbi:MAG: hypothetical protein V1754_00825, partial [Pseudomonadota bacterium]